MRTALAVTGVLATLVAAGGARAAPEVALRLAIAPAVGSATAEVPVSEALPLQVPVQLDALWREGPVAAGLYGSWGVARYGGCDGASCSASVTRLGLQATWSFSPIRGAAPWAGLGTGYEWASARRVRSGTSVDLAWRGLELVQAQGGVEWRVAPRLAVGPFLLVGAGRYARYAVDTGVEAASAEIGGKAIHAWIHVGVRGRLALGGTP